VNYPSLLNRTESIFKEDVDNLNNELIDVVSKSKILVVGGAGSIGQSVVLELFKRSPKLLHVVDLSENNLVELVRNIRGSLPREKGEFKTFAIDSMSPEFSALIENQKSYDYVFNLSAMKHVRSEKDPYTLMRLIKVNILNSYYLLKSISKGRGLKNYFCVSSDKASNPVSMMGASKKIMEKFLLNERDECHINMSRFANVAFSDGSLLYGFHNRLQKKQPLAAPDDVKRYFISSQESGELCLLTNFFGKNAEIFFPKMDPEKDMVTFSEIAINFLRYHGYDYIDCNDEEEARDLVKNIETSKKWPCLFTKSDTTGEKEFEEFYEKNDDINLSKFSSIGLIKNIPRNNISFKDFVDRIDRLIESKNWQKEDIVSIFEDFLPDYNHEELNTNLDQKM